MLRLALLMASFRSTMAYSVCENLMSCFSLKLVWTISLTTDFQSTLLPFARPRAQDVQERAWQLLSESLKPTTYKTGP